MRVGDWESYKGNLGGYGSGYTIRCICQKDIFLKKIYIFWLFLVPRNIVDFCIFILDPAHLPNFATSVNDSYVDNYKICEL